MTATLSLRDALADVFGFRSFRPHQEEIVRAVLDGRDVFAVMPTGGGKSLCYQLPARLMDGVCVVVSPLIALMKDQVDAARANGLRAAALNSATSPGERSETARALARNELDLLYVSPERFNTEGFVPWLKTRRVAFFAIDEAHCISAWGHDFRPDYLSLERIAREFDGIPVAAFTATATARVAQDILARLGLRDPHLTRASFNRPNLFYEIAPKVDFEKQLAAFLRARPGESGIVYRTTRKEVERTVAFLRPKGIDARAYHAGLPDDERADVQEAFQRDECSVIVATIAFGMGVDKPNVRFVVHGDIPKNIEAYYQETGRAGRDGDPAHCALFFRRGDAAQLARFAREIADDAARAASLEQLNAMVAFAGGHACRRAGLLAYFGETLAEPCTGCDACSGAVETEDATISAQKALSAVARTGGRFGVTHLVDLLRGAQTEKIRERGHHELPTHGVGRDRPKAYWKRLYDALVASGHLAVDDPTCPTPRMTERGRLLMTGAEAYTLRRLDDADAPDRAEKARARVTGLDDAPYPADLFEALRKERKRLADESGIAAFMVFSDRTLRDMARRAPRDATEMLSVHGVGQQKLAVYGEAFLAALERGRE